MVQAVAELPDPLEMPLPANLAGTDDLISQIAGDEIDRLMAESESGIAAPERAGTPAPAHPVSPTPDELTELLDKLHDAPAAKPQAAATTVDSHTPTAETSHAVVPVSAASVHDADALMSTAERDALGLSNLSDATDAAEHQDATHPVVGGHVDVPAASRARSGILIRLLEGLNAPLSFVPDAARDAIGKLAIITLANSVAVLVYVLLFRR